MNVENRSYQNCLFLRRENHFRAALSPMAFFPKTAQIELKQKDMWETLTCLTVYFQGTLNMDTKNATNLYINPIFYNFDIFGLKNFLSTIKVHFYINSFRHYNLLNCFHL